MVQIHGLHHRQFGFTPWTLDSDPDRIQHFQYFNNDALCEVDM